jgi:hypothetical protein
MADLATSLAIGVLQYHSTPWLPETWQSNHVHFFDNKELLVYDSGVVSSLVPYFRVDPSKPNKGKAPMRPYNIADATGETSAVTNISTPTIMNDGFLLRLGIVLLELAYGQPWPRLRQRVFMTLPLRRRNDIHAAKKLAEQPCFRDRTGPRFATVIYKCLGYEPGRDEQVLESLLVDIVASL